ASVSEEERNIKGGHDLGGVQGLGQLQIWEAPTKRFTWKSRFVLFVPAVLGTTLLLILAAPLGQAQGTLDPAKVMNTRVTAECRASTKMAGRAAFMQTFPMLMQTVLNPELTTTPTPTCPLGTESSPQCLPSGCF